ncbi:MAG: hypothetical protein HQK77_04040 [Desulfobacterales bacterium]|nr:hypothetical protein [Desulfobacterales bacterium]
MSLLFLTLVFVVLLVGIGLLAFHIHNKKNVSVYQCSECNEKDCDCNIEK